MYIVSTQTIFADAYFHYICVSAKIGLHSIYYSNFIMSNKVFVTRQSTQTIHIKFFLLESHQNKNRNPFKRGVERIEF